MTTTDRPRRGTAHGRALLGATGAVVGAVALVAAVGLATSSRAGAGALVGGSLAGFFLVLGSLMVAMLTHAAPGMAMVGAVLTYTLQAVMVLVVFVALESTGTLGGALDERWTAAGVVTAAGVWIVAQMVLAKRARVLLYDLPGDPVGPSPRPPQGGTG